MFVTNGPPRVVELPAMGLHVDNQAGVALCACLVDHDNVVPSAHSIGARQKRCPGLWLQRLCRYANMAQVVVGRLQQGQALVGAQLVVGLLMPRWWPRWWPGGWGSHHHRHPAGRSVSLATQPG